MAQARYAAAGGDSDAGNRMVELIKPLVRATARAGADAEIGGFGGLFAILAAAQANAAVECFTATGETVVRRGEVTKAAGKPRVAFRGRLDLAG